MRNLLILSDQALDLSFVNEDYDFIKLYKKSEDEILLDTLAQDSDRTRALKATIEDYKPERILVVGEMGEYLWLGTVLSSLFGKFNAWLGQYDQDYASTEIKVDGHQVPLLAIKSLDQVDVYQKWRGN